MEKLRVRFLAGIFVVSAATLCLEITLTRYFSISQQYHFAFLVVSITFLGYGASGSAMTVSKRIFAHDRDRVLSYTSLAFACSVVFCFLLCNRIPFDFIQLAWDAHHVVLILLYYVLLSVPFFFAGLTIALAIAHTPAQVNKIYFCDLIGAGCGIIIAVLIFLPKGDRGVILIISLLALIAAALFSQRQTLLYKIFLGFLITVGIGLFLSSPAWLSFRISPFKALPLANQYAEAKTLLTKWNSISRIDIIESPAVRFAPGLSLLYTDVLPTQMGLSVDGGDLTAVTSFKDRDVLTLEFLSYLPSFFPYLIAKNPKVLILEPKGGLDVLTALQNEAADITVIENNPLIVSILRNELAAFSGEIYNGDQVHIVTSTSRTAVEKDKELYNLIVLSLTDIFGSTGTGLFGFGENYLYTVESFMSLFKRLSSDGIISMSFYLLPPPRQELRVLATWIEALARVDKKPAKHIIAIRSWGTISFFVKKSPFTGPDIQKLKDFTDKLRFDLVHYPGMRANEANIYNMFEEPIYYEYCLDLLTPDRREEFTDKYLFQIKPVSDERPFFYNFFKLGKIKATFRSLGQKLLPFFQGEFLVLLILIQAIVIAFILILLPLLTSQREKKDSGLKQGVSRNVFFYFGLIGMAFMFVEITLIQKFILYLGHPLYSFSVILFSLLLSSGIGSLLSKKILGENIIKNLRWCFIFCSVSIFASFFIFPAIHENLIGVRLGYRILLTSLSIFPVGFLMGFPFPSGIRLLDQAGKRWIPWAWAINAFSSIINSVVALLIAFIGGYSLVLFLAGAGYLIAPLFLNFSPNTKIRT
ncbi:MAG: hypothetical protein WBE11_12265 [Candidatus Aminicenantaceae bacterium]